MARVSATVEAVAASLLATEQQAAKLARELSPEQANWQLNAHSWSIRKCLDHLAKTNDTYAGALEGAIKSSAAGPSGTQQITPGWFGSWFVQKLEPPVKLKLKNPGKVSPAETGEIQDTLMAFVRSHESARRVLQAASTKDLNRIRFRNPFVAILRFTVGTGLMIINAHDRRHLWQAEQVLQQPGFPKS